VATGQTTGDAMKNTVTEIDLEKCGLELLTPNEQTGRRGVEICLECKIPVCKWAAAEL